MKQYLHTIMRSLCIMVMLCGISTGAWAQSDWSEVFQLENPGENGSGNPYLIESWDDFFNNVNSISTSNVYFKLNTSVEIDGSSTTWTPISGFSGYFDGNNKTITMSNCNILSCSLFEGEASNSNIKNITYSVSNITITNTDDLSELKNNYSKWTLMCKTYTIDTNDADIDLSDLVEQGYTWTPIGSKEDELEITYEGTYKIIFPSCPVSNFSSNPVCILACENTIQDQYQYSELTIRSYTDVDALSSNENLLNACSNFSLTGNIDYTSYSDLATVPSITFNDGTTFDQNEYDILLPGFRASDEINDINKVFYGSGVDVECTYSGILITDSYDFTEFLKKQEDLKEICTNVIFSCDPINISDCSEPIDSDFDLSGEVTIVIDTQAGIDTKDGINNFINVIQSYDPEIFSFEFQTATDKGDNWYDFDFTSLDLSDASSFDFNATNDVICIISENADDNPFDEVSGSTVVCYHYPSCLLLDALYNGAITDESKRNSDNYDAEKLPFMNMSDSYHIATYEMLDLFATFLEEHPDYNTSELKITLESDICAQGSQRLTDDKGTKITDSPIETAQFNNFKGTFDGQNHSIGGLTRPLFCSLEEGAKVENLGIVDCYMSGAALTTSASGATITMSYVSGVSDGLVSEDGNTVENCYAYNPSLSESNRYTPSSTFNASTVLDVSKTHNILADNCYELKSDVYSDCTLFIPEDNTFYEVSPSNDFFKWESGTTDIYMYYINMGDDFVWFNNPLQSNVSMLHNVVYRHGWLNNNTSGDATNVGGLGSLDYLYSWYVVDKKPCDVSALEKSSELGMCCRVKNIYYSRNSTNVIPKTPAPDGLNTIYLPFAWNPATDLYYTNSDEEEELIDDAKVHILADKLTETTDGFAFNDDVNYKDYSMEKSLLFFDPANTEVDNSERYDNFAGVSNALPTLLEIPEGKSGWYIKRSELANFFTPRNDSGDYDKNSPDAEGLDNLYNNYWEDQDHADGDNQKIGRSFMEIDRLGKDWTNWGESDGSYSNYTRTVHYTCEDKGYGISGCANPMPINKTNEDKTVGDSKGSEDIDIYKANEDGAIAIEGDDKPLTIFQVDPTVNGSDYQLKIYQATDNDEIAYNEDSEEPVFLHETDGSDIIHLDDDGNPTKIYVGEQEIGNIRIESDYMTGEVINGEGDFQGKVVIKDESSYYPVTISPYKTDSNDRIVLDSEGYPAEIRIYDSVTIKITRENGTITGEVVSGEGDLHDNVIIEDEQNCYPIKLHVCGGHEEEDTNAFWDGSDFPGRAYHLGTFKTIGKGESYITFGAGTYTDASSNVYSCYKLNSAGTGFAKVTATSTVQPFRTFFAIAPGPDTDVQYSDLAKAYTLGFCGIFDGADIDDTPTEIDGVPVEGIKLMTTAQSRVYSLDGRYVGQYGQKKLARGMYIMNGKKFVVK